VTSNNPVSTGDRQTVERYLAAMQAGAGGIEDLVGLFDEHAVYVEPFTGMPQVHTGRAEIRAFYQRALEQEMRDARLTLERLDIDGDRLRSEWTCHLPVLGVELHGFDLLSLRDGRIVRLETTVTEGTHAG
jgi:ketosteroid isomerase-like protein